MKIIVDILGGDGAPKDTLDGALSALKQVGDLELVLVGDKGYIEPIVTAEKLAERVEIIHTTESISCEESPTVAIKQKVNSSLVLGFDALKKREDCHAIVSAGSTGAILTGAFMKIGRIEGVSRPALCPLLPTRKAGVSTMLIDCGANVDCKPVHLAHFALMADAYMRGRGVDKPRVALVNVGTEDKKGNELTHQTFEILKNLPINFVGNMEARDAFSGEYDILVCDGFVGNVLLKTAEGSISFVMSKLKKSLSGGFRAFMGKMFMGGKLKGMRRDLTEEAAGGSMFIGIKKPVVKAHGNSSAVAFKNAILTALDAAKTDLTAEIAKALADSAETITKMTAEK